MKTQLAATGFLLGALIVPFAGYAADADKERSADRSSPKDFAKDFAALSAAIFAA